MIAIRVVAISTETCVQVRASNNSPRYGHPAHTEVAGGYGPCCHCLRTFNIGEERRTLFTYDPFEGIDRVPQPGPIFIHTEACERYPETAGYPDDLRKHAAVLDAYASVLLRSVTLRRAITTPSSKSCCNFLKWITSRFETVRPDATTSALND